MPRHNHGGSTYGGGGHQHSIPLKDDDNNNDDNSEFPETGNGGGGNMTGYTNSAGTHEHSIYEQGWNAPIDNRPPYYVLAYIIKL